LIALASAIMNLRWSHHSTLRPKLFRWTLLGWFLCWGRWSKNAPRSRCDCARFSCFGATRRAVPLLGAARITLIPRVVKFSPTKGTSPTRSPKQQD